MTSRRTLLGGVASLGLLVAARRAVGQRPVKPFRIGYLSLRAGPNARDEAFVQRLRELGYTNGDNLLFEYRWAGDDRSSFERQAAELVRLPVDVIVTAQVPALRIVRKATATIPIVMAAVVDPVGAGLISSLARPGGNVTGLSCPDDRSGCKASSASPRTRSRCCADRNACLRHQSTRYGVERARTHSVLSMKPKQRDGCWALKCVPISSAAPPIRHEHLPR